MLPHPKVLRKKAREQRSAGISYAQIAKTLNVGKSTVRNWTHSVPLSESDKLKLYTNRIKILNEGAQSQKQRRQRDIEQILTSASREIHLPLSTEELRLAGTMLYWGEGSKGKDCRFTNSDPLCVAFMVDWFNKILNIPPTSLKASLNIYAGQDELELKRFWSEVSGIPLENFGKTYIKPPNKNYKKNILYYGTIQIRAAKGADLVQKINGWVLGITESVRGPLAKQHQKWYSLRHYKRS